jgi:hypothetical protein
MTHTNLRVESRTCIKCGEVKDILQRHKYAINTCADCQRIASREYQRLEAIRKGQRIGQTGRVPYPLTDEYKTPNAKFRDIAKHIFKLKDRDEWIIALRNNLDKTFNDKEVMDWINAHNADNEPIKRQKVIHSDYPDTRYITWEEYTKGLGEDDVDS